MRDDSDRDEFVRVLAKTVTDCRWKLHSWVLMSNHFHLVLETPEPNLSHGMRQLNGITTQRFNRRHGRTGHLYQGRFHGILVQKERHLLELCRYVALNPVRAGLTARPEEWAWSSYRATVGLDPPPSWLDVEGVLSPFGPAARSARQRFVAFVLDGLGGVPSPWAELRGQIYLGSESFGKEVRRRARPAARSVEVPRAQRSPFRPSLRQLAEAVVRDFTLDAKDLKDRRQGEARKVLSHLARTEVGASLAEVASVLGVTPWAASSLARRGEEAAEKDPAARRRRDRILRALGHEPETRS